MKSDKSVMHVLSHTHWDREWYQDFQGYRQRLVYQMDRMMELLETQPRFRHFHLDGQTCVLEDYTAIKPEQRERLARHIRSGRVLIGPWFVMPDERLLSGESLVRNLLLGHRLCAEWGAKPMRVGYVTDVFGHCSQLPQILKGFGINAAMLHRGTSCAREKSEMVWEGADGSEVLLVGVYQHTGYNDFLNFREWTDDELRAYEKTKLALATTNVLYALDGNDHQPARRDIPEQIARVNKVFGRIRCVHSSMSKYLDALWMALGRSWTKGRKRFVGELNLPAMEGQWSEVMNGIGSSRPYLKQANDALEQLLARVAEPLHAWAVVSDGQSQKGFLNLAWHYLLLNHPHDSICGCSIDQVHRDMVDRFTQSRLLAENSVWESIQAVGRRVSTAALGADAAVTVFNPSTAATGPVTAFSFQVESKVVAEKAKKGLAPALTGPDRKTVAFDILDIERGTKSLPFTSIVEDIDAVSPWVKYRSGVPTPAYAVNRPQVDRFHVAAAAVVPPLGYSSLGVTFVPRKAPAPRLPKGLRPVKADAMRREVDNGLVKLAIGRDGRVDIFDKATGVRYPGLHVFEDCGDAGEGWNHKYPGLDKVILSTNRKYAGRVAVKLDATGPLTARAVVSFALRVPVDLADGKRGFGGKTPTKGLSRSDRLTTLRVDTTFTVTAGSKRVDCRTVVRNTAQCHRLRVLFPTSRRTDVWYSDSAFDIVKRRIKLIDTAGWKEEMRPWQVMKSFAAAADRRGGLAVLTKGLQEAAVSDDRDRTLALTLFRAFRENIDHTTTRESQLLGEVVSEYALLPFTPEKGAVPAGIFGEVDRYKLPVYSLTLPAQDGNLPAEGTFVEASAPAAVSTIKTSEDGKAIVVRVFNPSVKAATVTLKANFDCRSAWKADLREVRVKRLALRRGAVALPLGAKEVATVTFERQ